MLSELPRVILSRYVICFKKRLNIVMVEIKSRKLRNKQLLNKVTTGVLYSVERIAGQKI